MEHLNVNVVQLGGTTKRVSMIKGTVDSRTKSLLDNDNRIVFKREIQQHRMRSCVT